MSDRPEALVRQALAGEEEAFSALVRKYQDYAYGVAVGVLSDFELARDVVQESFLCAYRKLEKLKDPARFGGWLRGIVRNMSFRAIRELGRIRELAEETRRTRGPFDPTPAPDEASEEAERHEIVRRALEKLNDPQREAVGLYYVNGLSYGEIAEFLDVTETAVQGRLQRARARLRKELDMVVDSFKAEHLPEGFADEIKKLLNAAVQRGREHEDAVKRLAEIGAPAVDPLCEALGDPRVTVRRAAARALCKIGDARALKPILRLLYSPDAWKERHDLTSSGAVLAVPGMREELLDIVRNKGGHADAERYWAIQALSRAEGDLEVYDTLLSVFSSQPDHQVVGALCRLRPDRAVDLLTDLLNGPHKRLKSSVPWVAHVFECLPPIEACLKSLERGVPPGARPYMGRLILKHGERGRAALEEAMRAGPDDVRIAAAVALAPSGDESALDLVKKAIRHPVPDRKWLEILAGALVRQRGGQVVTEVELDKLPVVNRQAILWMLAKLRPRKAPQDSSDLLGAETPSARAAGVRILARRGGARAIPELRKALRETRPGKVAQTAFWEMLKLHHPNTLWRCERAVRSGEKTQADLDAVRSTQEHALSAAREMLTSPHWGERKAAVCLLRRWGKLTDEQKAHACKDEHIAVRHAAEGWNGPHWRRSS